IPFSLLRAVRRKALLDRGKPLRGAGRLNFTPHPGRQHLGCCIAVRAVHGHGLALASSVSPVSLPLGGRPRTPAGRPAAGGGRRGGAPLAGWGAGGWARNTEHPVPRAQEIARGLCITPHSALRTRYWVLGTRRSALPPHSAGRSGSFGKKNAARTGGGIGESG